MKWANTMLMVLLMSISRAVPAQSDEKPSMEFLEFLGEWQDEQGDWVDPLDLAEEKKNENSDSKGHEVENGG